MGVIPERSRLEDVYRTDGKRLWWAVLAYSGDPEIASDAVAEAFAQALRAERGIRSPADWVWRVDFAWPPSSTKAGPVPGRNRRAPTSSTTVRANHLGASGPLGAQRAAVVLHYYGGYTAREIGSMTGTSGATSPCTCTGRARACASSWRNAILNLDCVTSSGAGARSLAGDRRANPGTDATGPGAPANRDAPRGAGRRRGGIALPLRLLARERAAGPSATTTPPPPTASPPVVSFTPFIPERYGKVHPR